MATQTLTIFVIAHIHEIPKEFGGFDFFSDLWDLFNTKMQYENTYTFLQKQNL